MPEWAVECEGLTKDYGARRAVWDLNLRVPRGSVTALLGRNGCGKTTTLKLIVGQLRPTRGCARILGHSSINLPDDVKKRVGYLVEGHPLYRTWSVRQLESFTRAFYPKWDRALFAQSLDRFEIDPARRVWSLSRGQRGMVALALVVAAEPEVLILDDPSMGLDAVVRRQFLEVMIETIQREGRTILLASHQLADVERVSDRIAILDGGVLRVDCRIDEFLERLRRVEFEYDGDPAAFASFPGLVEWSRKGAQFSMTLVDLDEEKRERIKTLAKAYEEVPMNLEDSFVAYAGRRPGRV